MGDVKHQSDNFNPHHLLGYGHNVTKRIPTIFTYIFFYKFSIQLNLQYNVSIFLVYCGVGFVS